MATVFQRLLGRQLQSLRPVLRRPLTALPAHAGDRWGSTYVAPGAL